MRRLHKLILNATKKHQSGAICRLFNSCKECPLKGNKFCRTDKELQQKLIDWAMEEA